METSIASKVSEHSLVKQPSIIMQSAPWVDAHGHLASERWSGVDRARAVARALDRGCTFFLQGGIDPDDWLLQREIAVSFPGKVGIAVGLHPEWICRASERELGQGLAAFEAEVLGQSPAFLSMHPVLWGELGLHFQQDDEPTQRERQERVFRRCLELLNDSGRKEPVVLHVVRAQGRALEIWDEVFGADGPHPGIVHSFGGSAEAAREWIRRGLLISPSPGVARSKGHETLKRAVAVLPEESLVFESDCPDQSPHRDQNPEILGEPCDVLDVARSVARLRGQDSDEEARRLLQCSMANLRRIGIPLP